MTKYERNVEHNLKGLTAVSTGACPDCKECADQFGFDCVHELNNAIEGGWSAEASFSHSGCGICGSHLGGDKEVWHAIEGTHNDDLRRHPVLHFDDACIDCVVYLANGDLPD